MVSRCVSGAGARRAASGIDGTEALSRAGARLRRLDIAIPRRRGGDQGVEQLLGHFGHPVDGAVENRLVGLGGARRSAQLADELQRRGADLLFGGRRLEVVQGLDVAAHGVLRRVGDAFKLVHGRLFAMVGGGTFRLNSRPMDKQLDAYRAKRDFTKTPEPAGGRAKTGGNSPSGNSYVIQKHAARRMHYEFRLELNRVLKGWAVPEG